MCLTQKSAPDDQNWDLGNKLLVEAATVSADNDGALRDHEEARLSPESALLCRHAFGFPPPSLCQNLSP